MTFDSMSSSIAVLTNVHWLLMAQLVHEGTHACHIALVDDACVQLPIIQHLHQNVPQALETDILVGSKGVLTFEKCNVLSCDSRMSHCCRIYNTTHDDIFVPGCTQRVWRHLGLELRKLPPEARRLLGRC